MKIKNMFLVLLMIGILIPTTFATLKLDDVQFDPAIISAGDNVDIVIQYHDEFKGTSDIKEGNPEYSFKVWIEPANSLSKQYVTFVDLEGNIKGEIIFEGKYYNELFKVKLSASAPSGDYKFNLVGQWFKNGKIDGSPVSLEFYMPVKKEGIILDIGNIVTLPSEVRPGDNFVKLTARIQNAGSKDAKSIKINLNLPNGITSSYTNNNRIWVGKINSGESTDVTFFVNIDKNLTSNVYDINYQLNYLDMDDNTYSKTSTLPFLVKSRPNLEIVKSEGTILQGDSGELKVYVKNIGDATAEAIDVRILLQNSQPFSMDVRSDYIGQLLPGETGVAIFTIKANSNAAQKNHNLQVSIRSKGDSDTGDDNIYIYSRTANLLVDGKKTNWLLYGGIAVLALVLLVFVMRKNNGHRK